MGLMDTLAAAPGMRGFTHPGAAELGDEFEPIEPDLSMSWDDATDETAAVAPSAMYLVCRQAGMNPDGTPLFGDAFATGNDTLALSDDGYLINSEGQFLLGLPLDDAGRPLADYPEVVYVDPAGLEAAPTTRIRYRANLASFPMTATADFDEPGSELLAKAGFSRDPSAHGSGAITGDDRMRFIDRSLAGGSVTVFVRGSGSVQVVFRWAKLGSLRSAGRDHWNLFYRVRRDPRASEVAWKNVGHNFVFGADGRLEDGAQSVPMIDMIVDDVRLGNITLTFGTGGITQFADRAGLVKVLEATADGRLGGEFVGISMSARGRLFAQYANSPMRPVADIHFTGDEQWFHGTCETTTRSDERRAA